MTSHTYCTYLDSAYLARARVLVKSLRAQGDQAPLFALALDDGAFREMASWTELNVRPVKLDEFENDFPELGRAKVDRSRMEYIFTLTPWFTRWVMERGQPGTWTTYLDADMAFFSPTDAIYHELSGSSVGIVEHRFSWEQRWRLRYGRFNVAWVSFRNDTHGRDCLEWWSERCLDWCHDRVDSGRFADQKYLDEFPHLFKGVRSIEAPGADLAPWNLRCHSLTPDSSGGVLVDGKPLIFFHFHGLAREGHRYYFKHAPYFARTTPVIRNLIYQPYCTALDEWTQSSEAVPAQDRTPDVLKGIVSGRQRALRWLARNRGDYIDVIQGSAL